jgi:hypothetical protein
MPNPWVSLRCDHRIPVNKAVNKRGQLEKGREEEEEKKWALPNRFYLHIVLLKNVLRFLISNLQPTYL